MLDEPRTDRVRAAFADLTSSVDPVLRPPGVESVLTTVRRRRQRRWGGVAAAAVAVAAVAGLASLPAMEQPAGVVADRPAPARPLPATALSPPMAPPVASASATALPAGGNPAATRTTTPDRDGGVRASQPPTPQPGGPPACVSTVRAAAESGSVVISADVVCPGETIPVSWATYEGRPDGSQQLFATERLTLTEARDRVVTTLRESPTCVGPWFVLRGHPSFPATIAAETAEPFPAELVLASADGELCLS